MSTGTDKILRWSKVCDEDQKRLEEIKTEYAEIIDKLEKWAVEYVDKLNTEIRQIENSIGSKEEAEQLQHYNPVRNKRDLVIESTKKAWDAIEIASYHTTKLIVYGQSYIGENISPTSETEGGSS